jgi:hypothetical protein
LVVIIEIVLILLVRVTIISSGSIGDRRVIAIGGD